MVKTFLMEGKWFKLVDALERFMNLSPKRADAAKISEQKAGNIYVPPRHNILKRPDFT
jgi:hypothetical protein